MSCVRSPVFPHLLPTWILTLEQFAVVVEIKFHEATFNSYKSYSCHYLLKRASKSDSCNVGECREEHRPPFFRSLYVCLSFAPVVIVHCFYCTFMHTISYLRKAKSDTDTVFFSVWWVYFTLWHVLCIVFIYLCTVAPWYKEGRVDSNTKFVLSFYLLSNKDINL